MVESKTRYREENKSLSWQLVCLYWMFEEHYKILYNGHSVLS